MLLITTTTFIKRIIQMVWNVCIDKLCRKYGIFQCWKWKWYVLFHRTHLFKHRYYLLWSQSVSEKKKTQLHTATECYIMFHANNENKCVSVFGDGLKEIKIELNDKWSIYANARAYKQERLSTSKHKVYRISLVTKIKRKKMKWNESFETLVNVRIHFYLGPVAMCGV